MATGDSGSGFRDFLSELQRRRVFRVAVLYAIGSFAILQVGEIVFPALKFPEWSLTFLVAIVLLGFPVAMVMAWAFDVTPSGVVRTEPIPDEKAPFRQYSRTPALIAVGVVSVLTVAAGWYLFPRLQGWWGEGRSAAAASDAGTRVVVLPFVNLGAPLDKYFADGITEEITARLATIQGLGVIARTTAVQYKDTDKTVTEIGQELDVDYVLEGTVRWESLPDGSSRVRVTPQLIRVADATHVWADIYEEPVASVFQVQSAIAERVVDEMGLTLSETERLALTAETATNVEAWKYYQLGNQYLSSSTTDAGIQEALAMFEKALELDPDFELAQRKLAEAHASLYWASFRMRFGVGGQDYERELDRLYLDSFGTDTASYHLTRAILLQRAGDTAAAHSEFDSARVVLEPKVSSRPGDASFHAQLGLAYAGLGRADDAVREGTTAVDLLPISEDAYAGSALADNLAHIYTLTGDYDAAVALIESILSVDAPVTRAWVANDPTWSPLRDDPRFQRLLVETG